MKNFTLILGGSSGLGKHLTAELLQTKHGVLALGRTQTGNPALHEIHCDLTESGDNILDRLDAFVSSHGPISMFIWNAGYLSRSPSAELSSTDVFDMIDINFRNSVVIALWVWRQMQANASGHFCVIASTVGLSDTPRDDEAIYAATKAAQVSFTRALGKNNRTPELKVTLFCPGGMKTNLWNDNQVDPTTFESFLDPMKVAQKMIHELNSQNTTYRELVIPRGSL